MSDIGRHLCCYTSSSNYREGGRIEPKEGNAPAVTGASKVGAEAHSHWFGETSRCRAEYPLRLRIFVEVFFFSHHTCEGGALRLSRQHLSSC